MSYHPRRPSDPSASPSPGIQGARTLASFLAHHSAPAYRESSNSHEFTSRTPRSAQVYDQRNTQPQHPDYHHNEYPREHPPRNANRHPSLSLDTRNLIAPTGRSPSPVSTPGNLHADLTTLKAGLEALWTRSAHTLHTLHHALSTERETRNRALRERDILAVENARMWEDRAHLEGEKRELRAKLDAQTATAGVRERAGGSGSGDVRVKREEIDDEDNVAVPMREVQRVIEERLRIQADEFARETTDLHAKLAAAQTRAMDLELYPTRPSMGPVSSPVPASGPAPQPPPRPPARPPSPVTPYTGQPSAHTEREFPFVRRRPESGTGSRDSDARIHDNATFRGDTTYAVQGGVPMHDSRAYAALRTHSSPGHPQPRGLPRDSYTHRRPHPTSHPHEHAAPRTVSLPAAEPSAASPRRRTASSSAPAAAPQGVPLPSASHQGLYSSRHPQPFRHHPLSQRPQHPLLHQPQHPVPQPGQRPLPHPPPSQSSRRPSPPIPPPSGPPPRPQSHPRAPPPPSPVAHKPTPSMEHSRPGTPTSRPAKRARTADAEPGTHEMTEDERRTLGALSSVLTKKRDGAGWKCVLCRQEKKNPTATFSETTPIGAVTQHVRGVHVEFWETLGGAPDT